MSAGERIATWVCELCPPGEAGMFRDGPHYVTVDGARQGLRQHVLIEHAAQLWHVRTITTFGRVLEFEDIGA